MHELRQGPGGDLSALCVWGVFSTPHVAQCNEGPYLWGNYMLMQPSQDWRKRTPSAERGRYQEGLFPTLTPTVWAHHRTLHEGIVGLPSRSSVWSLSSTHCPGEPKRP